MDAVARYEAVRVDASGVARRLIVERDDSGWVIVRHDLLGQRALADLSRTQDQHDSAVAERIDDQRTSVAFNQH